MGFQSIRYEVVDRIATITLDRPQRHNALTVAMAGELGRAWADVKANPEVVVAIVTGAGDSAFCTGIDLVDVADGTVREEAARVEREEGRPFYAQITAIHNRCWKPVITAVNGMVASGGLHFVADGDLVIAAEHATFFDTHVKVGMIAGLEPVGLVRRIPLEHVLRMAFLGGSERLTAQQALAIGLVGEVVPKAELLPRARALAAKIAEHSPTALAKSKQAIWESLDAGLHAGLDRTWQRIVEHTAHPDTVEGARAFVEKRKPRWAPFPGDD